MIREQLEFDFSEKKKDVPVRKPGAVPPKTQTIKKFKDGSKPIVRKENLDERIQRMVYQYDGKPNDNNCPTCGEELQEPNKEEEE